MLSGSARTFCKIAQQYKGFLSVFFGVDLNTVLPSGGNFVPDSGFSIGASPCTQAELFFRK